MASLEPIDLLHEGSEQVIGVYLLETDDGLALFDCGPASCIAALRDGLRERGTELHELRHLLLSHIHLDHAGAAGVLVREHPRLQVHVSEVGAPHLVDPSRLERSARRLYGDAFDALWGELAPVPEENVSVVGERVLDLECFPTPGHASHHLCYLDRDGVLYAGDAAGVRIQPSSFVLPPTPPPDFDPVAWSTSLDEIEHRGAERLALIHFGVAADAARHIGEMRQRLDDWVRLIEHGASEDEFITSVRDELARDGAATLAQYERAMPFWQSYAGLARYREKKQATA